MLKLPRNIIGQVTSCSDCGRRLRERKRKPCPSCGCMARTHRRETFEVLGAEDKVN